MAWKTNKRWNKFNAERKYSPLLKRTFDSKAECRYGEHLFARQANGKISELKCQVTVPFIINGINLGITHRVDFEYFETDIPAHVGEPQLIHDEFKGFEDKTWKLKQKLWAAGAGPGLLKVTRLTKDKMIPFKSEWIIPKRS